MSLSSALDPTRLALNVYTRMQYKHSNDCYCTVSTMQFQSRMSDTEHLQQQTEASGLG